MKPIKYNIKIEHPWSHILEVKMTFLEVTTPTLEVMLPTWTPGSYKIRDYVKHVMNVRAEDGKGEELKVSKSWKSGWKVEGCGGEVVLRYQVYCHNEGMLSPRESHVGEEFALLHFPTLLMGHMESRQAPVQLQVEVPKGWSLYSSLLPVDVESQPEGGTFEVPGIDQLYDTPLLAGKLIVHKVDVDGIPHYITINEPLESIGIAPEPFLTAVHDLVKANRRHFDHFPYDQYRFHLFFTTARGGGLEHFNSSVNVVPRDGVCIPATPPPYDQREAISLLGLLAHEHFHSWNVKEFGPEAFYQPDFTKEIDTQELWTVEGFANYFDERALLDSGLINEKTYLKDMVRAINQYESTPGHCHDSLLDCGANAWFKFYEPTENDINTCISYYLAGSLTAGMLDLEMLDVTSGEVGLSALLRDLSENCRYNNVDGHKGYPLNYFQEAVCRLTHHDLSDFFDRYVRGAQSLPFDTMLKKVGLILNREETPDLNLGLRFDANKNELLVTQVVQGGCGYQAGLSPGDEIIAVDKRRVDMKKFVPMLRRLLDVKKKSFVIDFFRDSKLQSVEIQTQNIDQLDVATSITFDDLADSRVQHLRNLWLCLHNADLEIL